MATPKIAQFTAGPVFGRSVTSIRAPRDAVLRKLAKVITSSAAAPVEVVHGSARAVLPPELVEMLDAALRGLESGEQLTLVVGSADADQVLTSQQTAELLSVSRPHVVKLANTGIAAPCEGRQPAPVPARGCAGLCRSRKRAARRDPRRPPT